MSRSRKIEIISLFLFALTIILPPIIHGYIYPTMGDDSGMHMEILKNSNLWNQLYFGYIIIGYPLKWFYDFTLINYNDLFLWFNFLVLIGVGATFYSVLSRLVNYKAGLFSLVIPFFISLGIWWEFEYGMIFNLINIGIILPLILYMGIRWITQRKRHHLIGLVLFCILFSLFHSTGIYLAPTLILLLIFALAFKRQYVTIPVIVVSILIVVMNLFASCLLIYQTNLILPNAVNYSISGKLFPISYYIMGVSFVGIIMMVISVYLIYQYKRINKESKLILYALSTMIGLLIISTLGFSPSPDRQIFDMAILFGLVVSVCVGIVVNYKSEILYLFLALVVLGSSINIIQWFDYRSVVLPIEKQVINYMNSLDFETYTVSSTVSPLIYKQFIKEKYIDGEAEVLIVRNEPMTPCSDKKSIAYVKHGIDVTDGYILRKTFEDGKIRIDIYDKIK